MRGERERGLFKGRSGAELRSAITKATLSAQSVRRENDQI